jgi:hypothetical protein
VLDEVSEDPVMVEALSITSVEQKAIDNLESREKELVGGLVEMSHSADLYDKMMERREPLGWELAPLTVTNKETIWRMMNQ